jgi:tetratricopeptide (TPR) repeat protein
MAADTLLSRLWAGCRVWLRGRDWRLLLGGAPALLVGGAFVALAALASLTSHEDLEARYLDRAQSAFKARDYASALTCYDRLAHLGMDRPEILFGLAQAALAQGQPGRAAVILNALAPPRRQGYPPAHLWTARRLLLAPTEESRQLAKDHLQHALNGDLDERDAAYGLLGQIYLMDKDYVQAEAYLARAVKAYPELRLKRAEMHARLGNEREARSEAQLAIDYFQARAKADLADHQARLTWADGVTFLEQFPEAAAILEDGLKSASEPAPRNAYRGALGRLYAAWLGALDRGGKGPSAEKFRLLEQGLRYDPSNVALLERLAAASRIEGPEAQQARAALQGLLARGEGSAMAHFALGVDAWRRGDEAAAAVHLEEAQRLAPQLPVIANNLAFVLAQGPAENLPRALELSNLALQRAPAEPSFRGTRGEILVRMKKWKEALPDLEAALPASPTSARLHQALAEVYAQLGVPAMAAEHQRLARKAQGAPADPGQGPAPTGQRG